MRKIACIILPFVCASCIGVKTVVTIKQDLSGTIDVVYTVSKEFLALGELDGNKAWPALPVGRTDFERTAARIDGLTLRSYREKESGGNRLFEASLAFDSAAALDAFLNAAGSRLVYKQDGGTHSFEFVFAESAQTIDDELAGLAAEALAGYEYDFTVLVPGGRETFHAPMSDLVTSGERASVAARF